MANSNKEINFNPQIETKGDKVISNSIMKGLYKIRCTCENKNFDLPVTFMSRQLDIGDQNKSCVRHHFVVFLEPWMLSFRKKDTIEITVSYQNEGSKEEYSDRFHGNIDNFIYSLNHSSRGVVKADLYITQVW